jgi:dipeptidase E
MKLYLGSYKPWESNEDFSKCVNMIGDKKKVAIIMNALDYSDDIQRVDNGFLETKQFLESFGLHPFRLELRDYFDKPEELEKQLNDVGLIFIYGGNTFLLRKSFAQSGLDELLPELLAQDMVYSGFSAGGCVLAPTLKGYAQTDDPNVVVVEYDNEIIWDGLGLVPYSIAPHYRSDHKESDSIEKEVEYMKENNIPYKTLHDGEAIVIDGEKTEFLSLEKEK